MASTTASGCSFTARPSSSGCRTWLSSCMIAMMMASTISAVIGPWATSAMSTATPPAITAPTMGTNAPRKTSAASGTANGTASTASPIPMATASTTATTAVART